MVYSPEPLEAGGPGKHPEAGQPETERGPSKSSPQSAGNEARNARRKAQRAAAKSAKAHQASTGHDLNPEGSDPTEPENG